MSETTIQPGYQDKWILSTDPNTVQDDAPGLFVGTTKRILVMFDISAIPATDTITIATLYLYCYGKNDSVASAYRVTNPWNAAYTCWNKRDSGISWTTAGGDFDASVLDSDLIDALGWHDWTVSSLVRSWQQGSMSNYGILLKEGLDAASFRSMHYNLTPSHRPKLVVTHFAKPTTAITVPTPDQWVSSTPTIEWSYTDGSGEAQSHYEVRWSTDEAFGSFYTSGEIASASHSHVVSPALNNTGPWYVKVRVKNQYGSWSDWSATVRFYADLGITGGILINNGQILTDRPQVALILSASASTGMKEMRIRNSGDSWPAWETYATSKTWTVANPDRQGYKTVEVQYKDNADNESDIYSASIFFLPAVYGDERNIHLKVLVKPRGRSDWYTLSALDGPAVTHMIEYRDRQDADIFTASFNMVLADSTDGHSIMPGDRTSPWNLNGAEYRPLLADNSEVKVFTAVTAPHVAPAQEEWLLLFHGYIDEVRKDATGKITIGGRDCSKRLQKAFITTERTYGSIEGTPMETVVQNIIDDNLGSGQATVYCPISPNFLITTYVEKGSRSVWEAIHDLSKLTGWDLRYIYRASTNSIELALYDPKRNRTNPEQEISWCREIREESYSWTDLCVRNKIILKYLDENGDPQTYETPDADAQESIDEYEKAPMIITEAATGRIDTAEEAANMANPILSDLKYPIAQTELSMRFMPHIPLFTILGRYNPKVASQRELFCIRSMERSISARKAETRVTCTGTVSIYAQSWFQLLGMAGPVVTRREGMEKGISVSMPTGNLQDEAVTKQKIGPDAVTQAKVDYYFETGTANYNVGAGARQYVVCSSLYGDAGDLTLWPQFWSLYSNTWNYGALDDYISLDAAMLVKGTIAYIRPTVFCICVYNTSASTKTGSIDWRRPVIRAS